MKNDKGQALVEFALILPVILMLIFCLIDFGRVILAKNDMENSVSDALLLYENGSTKEEIQNVLNNGKKDLVFVETQLDGNYFTITVKKKINPITPGLNHISKDVFDVSASRVIKNE